MANKFDTLKDTIIATSVIRAAVLTNRLMDGFKGMDLSEDDDPGGEIRSTMFILGEGKDEVNYYKEYKYSGNYINKYANALAQQKLVAHIGGKEDASIKQIELDLMRIEDTFDLAKELADRLKLQKNNILSMIEGLTSDLNTLYEDIPTTTVSATGKPGFEGVDPAIEMVNSISKSLRTFCKNSIEKLENVKDDKKISVINTMKSISMDHARVIRYLLTCAKEDLEKMGIDLTNPSYTTGTDKVKKAFEDVEKILKEVEEK